MGKMCKDCKWHIERVEIEDEAGKHECYAHSLICSPISLGYEIEKENDCDKFQEKGTETEEEIQKEFFRRPLTVDKTMKLLSDNSLKFFASSGF